MPKKSKKGYLRGFGDITLNDFANSTVPKQRIKKSSNNVNIALKNEVEKIEKSWDDKDEEDFEGTFVPVTNEDGTTSFVIQKVEKRRRKKTVSSNERKITGNGYPIDIWYLISEYIRPEDVGTFAAICQTSFEVVCSARFWFGLYRRYYKNVPTMPETLQPESLIRRYGLRKNVIRALFYMYPPFVERIKPITTFEEHPESLKNYECHVVWHTTKNSNFIYFFKMRRKTLNPLSHSKGTSKVPDLLEILDDISANPDEHCRLLEVSCLHFNPVQPVLGLVLKSVSLTLSSSPKFRYYRLQLIFATTASNLRGGADSVTVILDPVINIKVLDWWHPLYPVGRDMVLLNED
ncbi:transmembrane protein 183 [Euwallacea similis]|uniref:transmembrane protein 183 n=1 Tax=Euwallacea similis TaxID=1736056 RepID=UPI0034502EF2